MSSSTKLVFLLLKSSDYASAPSVEIVDGRMIPIRRPTYETPKIL